MNIPRQDRASPQAWALVFAFAVAACGGAEDAGLTGENTDPEGHGASSSGGAGSGGTDTGGAGDASGGGNAGTGGASDGTEDCLNGRDDDGDGDVDCADDECVAVSCVPEAPEGWSGPIAFRDVDNAAADGLVCPDGFPAVAFEAGGELDVEPATCSACKCEVTADQCEAFAWTSEDGCRTVAEVVSAPIECVDGYDLAGPRWPTGFDAEYVGGCSVADVQSSLPAAAWGRRALGCAAAGFGGGCFERAICAPKIDAGSSNTCIFREGDRACNDDYPARILRYRELNDERCETCCGGFAYPSDPFGFQICSVNLERYDDSSCTQPSEPSPNSSPECRSRSGGYYTAIGEAPERSSCGAQSVARDPVGPVGGDGMLTICCVE